ncbi:MAG: DUF1064 domain-containing protein [Candidatus Omnitrophica bacterium]|nr:DUF1064 domain-containing protein [Candidatus Omnitrophota bacterium]
MRRPPGIHAVSKRSKYGNRITCVDGIRFDSVAEGLYYRRLVLLKAAGEIAGYERQVLFGLEAGIRYVADFVVWPLGREMPWYAVDVKGVQTRVFRLKAKLFTAKHPNNPLIIAKAVYQKGKFSGFRETVFGKGRKKHVGFQ